MWYVLGGIVLLIILVLLLKKAKSGSRDENILEKYVQQTAEVTETVNNTLGTGKVNIDGMMVHAKKDGPGTIDPETTVVIKAATGSSVIVEAVK